MKKIILKTAGKLNLSLGITGTRDDGYHLMDMVMQSVSVYDTVSIEKNNDGAIKIKCDKPHIPTDHRNIVYKSAQAFFEFCSIENQGITITIEKNVPDQAGMAGGSGNGAGVLVGLNEMYGTNLSATELMRIGEKIGADIPFCIVGGTAHVTGIGEIVINITPLKESLFVIVKGEEGVSTKLAFEEFDNGECSETFSNMGLIDAIEKNEIEKIYINMRNVLEPKNKTSEIYTVKRDILNEGGKYPLMTGSGAAVFSLMQNKEKATEICIKLKEKYDTVFLAESVQKGVEIIFSE